MQEEVKQIVPTIMPIDIDITQTSFYEKGYEKGIEQGIKKGIEKGKEDTLKKIVKKLLGKLSKKEIAEITGLSLEQINKIEKKK